MPYKLNSITYTKRFKGKSIKECIDNYYFVWENFINNHPEWYDQEVFDYINDKLHEKSDLNKRLQEIIRVNQNK